jgi:zinc D-Ala-D-Ala carboxypeptidase
VADLRLSPNFALSELVRSQTALRRGIDNMPPAAVLLSMRKVLAPGLERVRSLLGVPVQITSGYRCASLNAAVGGAKDSQHMQGLAADIVAPAFGSPREVARYLAEHMSEIRADQVIYEGQWCHVSFADKPRGEVLTAHFSGGAVTYSRGIA